ncbi:uncharacterized protein LOC143202497 isoform X2 [Rhynchophorus ferrugineus]|uniref:uncharacterized protein LOC143202497 isoform X2 n=1 Tax=Rhynchophorus ferrugineus TaxID=354439 RepID=UPI003FCD00C1
MILVIVALALLMTMSTEYKSPAYVGYMQYYSNFAFQQQGDAFIAQNISASVYIIILLIILGLLVIKDKELDKQFSGVLLIIGALLLLGSGIAVAVVGGNYTSFIVSGIMAIVAGIALFIDALKCFGLF